MNTIKEERIIANLYCIKVQTPSGSVFLASGKTREEALEKALWGEPEPA